MKDANQYDKIVRENLEELFIPFIVKQLGLSVLIEEVLPDKLHTTEEREMDLLLKLKDSKNDIFLLHVEFQSKPDYEMIWRMVEYHGLITKKYKLAIKHIVVDLDESKTNIITALEEKFKFTGFEIIKLHDVQYLNMITSQVPAEIILAILGDFGDTKPEIIIKKIAERLKSVSKSDAELKKYVAQLNVLSRLRNLQDLITQTISKNMPILFDIENDSLVKEGISRAKRRSAERSIMLNKLSNTEIAMILDLPEETVWEIKEEMEKRNKSKQKTTSPLVLRKNTVKKPKNKA
jgi:predicted RNA-binding protein with PIN domain